MIWWPLRCCERGIEPRSLPRCTTGALLQKLTGHTNWVLTVALSADASTVASGSADGSVGIWNVREGTQCFGRRWPLRWPWEDPPPPNTPSSSAPLSICISLVGTPVRGTRRFVPTRRAPQDLISPCNADVLTCWEFTVLGGGAGFVYKSGGGGGFFWL